jgi:hypothetical protein
MSEVDPPAVHDTADPDATTDYRPPCPCCDGRMIMSRSLRAAVHSAGRPPALGSRPDPMTFRPVPWQHPFRLKRQSGYDQTRLEKLLHAVGETMDEIGADKAEIYNPQAGDNFIIAHHSPDSEVST